MLVKAKWNIKDSSGWHTAGEVFNTESDLGEAVEVIGETEEPAKEPDPVAEPEQEPAEKTTAKPRSSTRRRVSK